MDVSYGGENGFNQAIELSAECLSNVKFIQEKKLIGRYFDEISQVGGIFLYKKGWLLVGEWLKNDNICYLLLKSTCAW